MARFMLIHDIHKQHLYAKHITQSLCKTLKTLAKSVEHKVTVILSERNAARGSGALKRKAIGIRTKANGKS